MARLRRVDSIACGLRTAFGGSDRAQQSESDGEMRRLTPRQEVVRAAVAVRGDRGALLAVGDFTAKRSDDRRPRRGIIRSTAWTEVANHYLRVAIHREFIGIEADLVEQRPACATSVRAVCHESARHAPSDATKSVRRTYCASGPWKRPDP